MNKKDDKLKFSFAWQALELLGQSLYTNPWNAIAELVANGFDAGADNVYVLIDARDKKNAHIEIMDDGCGMSRKDLETYVKVGHDRRADPNQINHVKPELIMGRKGIGKLAALFLSHEFKLATKTGVDKEEVWGLSEPSNRDEEPALRRISLKKDEIENPLWDELKSGTLLVLEHVNLIGYGKKAFEGLSHSLANQFALNALTDKKIFLCVLIHESSDIVFKEAEKSVAFRNLAQIAYNLPISHMPYDIIQIKDHGGKVLIPYKDKNIEKCFEYSVEIVEMSELKTKDKQIKGTYRVPIEEIIDIGLLEERPDVVREGDYVSIPYELKGWLGFHATINKTIARKNDERFEKDKFYNPAKIRLYVRNKLATDSVLNNLGLTAAFTNYIEGEISFDLLDDDLLPDIATSNRQGFNELDSRWTLLVNILRPLVRDLINRRDAVVNARNDAEMRIKNERASRAKGKATKQFREEIKAFDIDNETAEALVEKQAMLLEGDVDIRAKEKYLVSLSHRKKDKQFVDFVYDLLRDRGAKPEDFFYTSSRDKGAQPQGNDPLSVQIKRNITEDNTLLSYFTSSNFRASEYCLFEAGAGWATRTVGEYLIMSTERGDIPTWLTNDRPEVCIGESQIAELNFEKYNKVVDFLNAIIDHINKGRYIKGEQALEPFYLSDCPSEIEMTKAGKTQTDYMDKEIVRYWNYYIAPFLNSYYSDNNDEDEM